jgi:hypothetical protein
MDQLSLNLLFAGGLIFWPCLVLENFAEFFNIPHHIKFLTHEVLNIDKKIKLITQFSHNSRDESFKPN